MTTLRFRLGLTLTVAMAALLAPMNTMAAEVIIPDGFIVTSTQVLSAPGDSLTVESGGVIDVDDTFGVLGGTDVSVTVAGRVAGRIVGIRIGSDSTITNSGTIEGALGIVVESGNEIENSGIIDALVEGVILSGTGNTVVNTGKILSGGCGIDGRGLSTISNYGTIEASSTAGICASYTSSITNEGNISGGETGIALFGNGNTVSNSGSIYGGQIGLDVLGTNNGVTNSGSIEGLVTGVNLSAAQNGLVNSGTIKGGEIGLLASSGNYITNGGTISGGSAAVEFTGSGNSLVLLRGSRVEGLLKLGTGNTLYIDGSTNLALSYEGTPAICSCGGRVLDTGSEIIMLDSTGTSAVDEQLNDLTRAADDTIDHRLNQTRGLEDAYSNAENLLVRPVGDLDVDRSNASVWASGLGSFRADSGKSGEYEWNTLLGGGVVGFDQVVAGRLRLGGMTGASYSRLSTDGDEDIDTTSYFLGAYGNYAAQTYFVTGKVIGGLSRYVEERLVVNNMVSGGSEMVDTDHDGWFVNPSLAVGVPVTMIGGTLTPTFRARYAAMFLEDYAENWTSADLHHDSRVVSLFDLRAQLAYNVIRPVEGGRIAAELRGGVDATFANAQDVQVEAASSTLDFPAGNEWTSWRGFGGLSLAYTTDARARFFLGGELGWSGDDSLTAEGQAGIGVDL